MSGSAKHSEIGSGILTGILILTLMSVSGCGDDSGPAKLGCQNPDTGCVDGEPCYGTSDCADDLLCIRENDDDDTGVCSLSPVVKCTAFVDRWCDRNDFCETDTKELCLRRVAETIDCSLATYISDTYDACLLEIDNLSCLIMGELPPSCWNMISFQ